MEKNYYTINGMSTDEYILLGQHGKIVKYQKYLYSKIGIEVISV